MLLGINQNPVRTHTQKQNHTFVFACEYYTQISQATSLPLSSSFKKSHPVLFSLQCLSFYPLLGINLNPVHKMHTFASQASTHSSGVQIPPLHFPLLPAYDPQTIFLGYQHSNSKLSQQLPSPLLHFVCFIKASRWHGLLSYPSFCCSDHSQSSPDHFCFLFFLIYHLQSSFFI